MEQKDYTITNLQLTAIRHAYEVIDLSDKKNRSLSELAYAYRSAFDQAIEMARKNQEMTHHA